MNILCNDDGRGSRGTSLVGHGPRPKEWKFLGGGGEDPVNLKLKLHKFLSCSRLVGDVSMELGLD